ncbi:MAG: ATP-binding cassette domain-containing protein [Candidatus Hydrothermae bacterium]|nr:ATP-binding cassette domain-containing protein [Candidatus Hydrothermae bacterium]
MVFEGNPLHELSEDERSMLRLRRVGFVFQAHNLIPVLTARENAELLLLLQGIPEEKRRTRVDELFHLLGIAGLQDRKPSEMSGGQQQRVAVIRAIAHRPSVLFLDEPTANLDTDTSRVLLDHLSELNRRENVTFIFSTHDPLVLEYAHRVLYMRDGKIQKDERRKGPSCSV